MIRMLKRDVLTDLPAKLRQIIALSPNGAAAAIQAEASAWSNHQVQIAAALMEVELSKASEYPADYDAAVARLREAHQHAFTEISQARHAVALAKVPYVIEHLENALAASGPVICFAHHRDVIAEIQKAFGARAVVVTGDTPMAARDVAVQRFQAGEAVIFVGNIQAAGTGLTLTAASNVVFAELDWSPGKVSQAEDRDHRIGQTNSVLVQHLVLDGSLDQRMAELLVQKQAVIDKALDDDSPAPPVPVAESPRPPSTANTSRNKIGDIAAAIDGKNGIVATVHAALKSLDGRCDGARTEDGAGFSKFDVRTGKRLASLDALSPRQAALGAVLARKYRRQLDDGTNAAVAGLLAAAKT